MPVQIRVPELGESVVAATVGRWLKQEGDPVQAGETVVELETDKVDLEVGAETGGILIHIEKSTGEDVRVGDVLATIEASSEKAPIELRPRNQASEKPAPAPSSPPTPAVPHSGDGEKATPVAARFAQEMGVDLDQIHGSGPGGRVTKQDVESFAANRKQERKPEPGPAPRAEVPPATKTSTTELGAPTDNRESRVRMSRRRRTIAQRLLEAKQSTAMLTTFNEIDMSKVIDIRQRRRDTFQERNGVKLGFMSFFVKASIGALKAFPQINSELQGDDLVIKHHYDIGIAVGASEGLVVPVLRDAERMSFGEIEKAIQSFSKRTEEGTLSIEDLRGGTFTITNGGIFGSLLSTPILNSPEVAILGLHKIEERPIAQSGQVVIRPMMYVALSYDHRVVDGREAVQFLVRIKQLVEDPETLLLEG